VINRSCSIGLIPLFLVLSACGGGGGQTPGSDVQSLTATDTGTSTTTGTETATNIGTATRVGTMSLKWVAPAKRSDGDPISLSEIDSYTVYFGTSAGSYPYSMAIEDASTTSIDIPGLPAGTYHVVMTTTDSLGQESGYSSVAVKKVM
jgi:hypothetical protein